MAAPTPLADVTDLSEWLGEPITEGDISRAGLALRMASALVRAEAGKTWLDADGSLLDVPEAATLVTLACAARVYSNPDGGSVTSEMIDDYQYREDSSGAEAGAYLTAAERALLGRLTESYRGGLATVTTERGDLSPWPCDEDERILPPYY